MSDITKFQNKRLTEIHDELEKDYTPERVMLECQSGNMTLQTKMAFELFFQDKVKSIDNTYSLMTSPQVIYWVNGWVVDSHGNRIPNMPKRSKVGRAVHKLGDTIKDSIDRRFKDNRGGLEITEYKKDWVVYPLASTLIDDELKKSIEYLPEPKWNGTIYGKTEFIELDTKQPIEQIIQDLVDKYNISENNLPKSPN